MSAFDSDFDSSAVPRQYQAFLGECFSWNCDVMALSVPYLTVSPLKLAAGAYSH